MYFFEGPARASAGAPPANGLPLAASMAASLLRMEVTFGRSVLDIPRGGRKNSRGKKCWSRASAYHARSSSNEAFVEAFSMSSSTNAHRGRCAGQRVALQPRSSQRIPAGPKLATQARPRQRTERLCPAGGLVERREVRRAPTSTADGHRHSSSRWRATWLRTSC